MREACLYAAAHDCLLVCAVPDAAVDEDMQEDYPIGWRLPNVIGVTSTTRTDTLYGAAAWGSQTVDLGAPGRVIVTVGLNGPCYTSGTSFATAMVTEAVALLRDAYPNQPAAGIKERLLRSVRPLSDLSGRSTSGGRLDVSAALLPEKLDLNIYNITVPYVLATGGLTYSVYDLQTSANLTDWDTEVQFSGDKIHYIDASGPKRYYRVKLH